MQKTPDNCPDKDRATYRNKYLTALMAVLYMFLPDIGKNSLAGSRPVQHIITASPPRPLSSLPDLAGHIDPHNRAHLLLILHKLGQSDAATLTALHDCARHSGGPGRNMHDNQEQFVERCKAELTEYTDLCLSHASSLLCSETAAALMLHGTTTLEPLVLP